MVNESDQPIEVRCKIIDLPGAPDPSAVTGPLSTADASRLRGGDREWRTLSDTEYRVDRENRTVMVRVMPGEALLVKRFHDTSMKNGAPTDFPIEEIIVAGAHGEIRLEGGQTSRAFVEETDRLYILAYK